MKLVKKSPLLDIGVILFFMAVLVFIGGVIGCPFQIEKIHCVYLIVTGIGFMFISFMIVTFSSPSHDLRKARKKRRLRHLRRIRYRAKKEQTV